tara:strand:- start:354 stop:491 length:138 start_codon:yes stop_codon:yes gene_type:complete
MGVVEKRDEQRELKDVEPKEPKDAQKGADQIKVRRDTLKGEQRNA